MNRVIRWDFSLACLTLMFCINNAFALPKSLATTQTSLHWGSKGGAWAPQTAPRLLRATPIKDAPALQPYLAEVATHLGWNTAALSTLRLNHVHDLGHGPILLRFDQAIDGRPVMPGQIVLMLRRDDYALLASSGRPIASTGIVRSPAPSDASYGYVVDRVKKETGQLGTTSATHVETLAGGARRYAVTRPGPVSEPLLHVYARPIFYIVNDVPVESYYVEATGADSSAPSNYMAYVVSADGQDILHSANRKFDLAFDYRVYGDATSSDLHLFLNPYGYTNPRTYVLPPDLALSYVTQQTLSLAHHPALLQNDPWLPDSATETVGNNVDAYFDIFPTINGLWVCETQYSYHSENGDFRAQTNGSLAFLYTYDPMQTSWQADCEVPVEPIPVADAQLNAEIVQAFYVTNWLHDLYYVHGFTETAGNTQTDNYGRGGQQGDALNLITGQGTFSSSTLDGQSPHLHMGPAWDLSVLGHEYFHVVYTRLHNWLPSFPYEQTQAMNEGWADFMGLLVSFDRDAPLIDPTMTGAYAVGGYYNKSYVPKSNQGVYLVTPATYDPYYYGIRRYPFSTDFAKNPLTFAQIEHLAYIPIDPPYFNWKGRANLNSQIHTAGEIWASALWGCFASLVTTHGVDIARDRMLDYSVAGITLEPLYPTYLEARNALLAVIQASSSDDYLACRSAFAQRGMGAGAIAPARDSIEFHGVEESFSTNDAALSVISSQLDDGGSEGILDVNETGQLSLTIMNSGFVALNDVQVQVSTTANISFPSGPSIPLPALAIGQSTSINIPVLLNSAPASPHQSVHFDIQLNSSNLGLVGNGSADAYVNYDWVRHTNATDLSAERTPEDWSIQQLANYADGTDGCWKYSTSQNGGYFAAAEAYGFRCALITPWLPVSVTEDLILQLDHAYDFVNPANAQNRGVGWIEISTDGTNWYDIDQFFSGSSFSYPGTYTDYSNTVIPGFVGTSSAYPSTTTLTLNFNQQFAGQLIKIRFLSDFYFSYRLISGGWFLHNLSIDGLTEPVFHEVLQDRFDWIFRDSFDVPYN